MTGQALFAVFLIVIGTSPGLWMAWGVYLGIRQTQTRRLSLSLSRALSLSLSLALSRSLFLSRSLSFARSISLSLSDPERGTPSPEAC